MGEYNSDSIHKMSVSVQFFTQIVSEKLLQNCILLLDQKSVVLTHELTDMRPAKYIKKRKVEKGKWQVNVMVLGETWNQEGNGRLPFVRLSPVLCEVLGSASQSNEFAIVCHNRHLLKHHDVHICLGTRAIRRVPFGGSNAAQQRQP
jgi:hypothetical protein